MENPGIPRMTNLELGFLTAALVFALCAIIIESGGIRLLFLIGAVLSGGGVYLLVARRLNDRHVDEVVASNEVTEPDKRGTTVRVDPQTKRLVFDDYTLSLPAMDEEADEDEPTFRTPFPFNSQLAVLQEQALSEHSGEGFRITSQKHVATDEPKSKKSAQQTAKKIQTPDPKATIEEPTQSHKRKDLNVSINELFDFSADEHIAEPRNEFDWLLARVLRTIKEVIPSYSVIFFWIDRTGKKLIIETKITDSDSIVPHRKIPFGLDIVSQIAESGLPEALTEISPNAECDLLGYYERPNGVRSFAGVPIYFNRDIVAVLALDSKDENAFDAHTIHALGQFTKIISGLIRGYTDKYDLHLSARAVRAVEKLRSSLPMHKTTDTTIARTLLTVAEEIVSWEHASVSLFDNAIQAWTPVVADVHHGEPQHVLNMQIALSDSIAGTAIRTGKPVIVGDLHNDVRFNPSETAGNPGSFLAAPLCTPLRSYGALCMEHSALNAFTNHDLDVLMVLSQTAAAMIESFHLNTMIDEQLMIDERTGVYNKRFLLSRLDENIARAEDLKEHLSFVLFGIDNPRNAIEKSGVESADIIVASIAKIVAQHARTYDILGRYDSNAIGIVLPGKTDEDAYIWAEKARKDIASTVLQLGAKNMTLTASAGVCGRRHNATHVDLLNGAFQALERAQEIGGNSVMVY